MRFFRMKQDKNIPYMMSFRDFDIKGSGHIFKKEDFSSINDTTILFLAGNGDEARPDFLQSPVLMVSDSLKSILDAYEEDLLFRSVIMIHQETEQQYQYYMVLMDEIDGKSEQTEYYPDQTEKRLVLDQKKISEHHIFRLSNSRIREPFVSLAVVESLLRRNISGILFEEVEVN